ncbi:hypothetical protein J6590_003622 [Homalodisca vitripennis]|nr:hypothetical protein J6590_003622 [Homalodisca vitripennis]
MDEDNSIGRFTEIPGYIMGRDNIRHDILWEKGRLALFSLSSQSGKVWYFFAQQGSLLAGLYLPVEPTNGHNKNRCERHITNRKFRDSGVRGQFDRSSLLQEMTEMVGYPKSQRFSLASTRLCPLPTLTGEAGSELASPSSGGHDFEVTALILPHGSR